MTEEVKFYVKAIAYNVGLHRAEVKDTEEDYTLIDTHPIEGLEIGYCMEGPEPDSVYSHNGPFDTYAEALEYAERWYQAYRHIDLAEHADEFRVVTKEHFESFLSDDPNRPNGYTVAAFRYGDLPLMNNRDARRFIDLHCEPISADDSNERIKEIFDNLRDHAMRKFGRAPSWAMMHILLLARHEKIVEREEEKFNAICYPSDTPTKYGKGFVG